VATKNKHIDQRDRQINFQNLDIQTNGDSQRRLNALANAQAHLRVRTRESSFTKQESASIDQTLNLKSMEHSDKVPKQ